MDAVERVEQQGQGTEDCEEGKEVSIDALAVAEKNVSFLQRGVEREENIKYCQGVMVGYANSILVIDNAPVVIPAERSGDV